MYVGSALGPGGIAARIKHHLTLTNTPHWHIDYFRKYGQIVEIWTKPHEERLEHKWALQLAELEFIRIPVVGFGSSDCSCKSHFFQIAAFH